MPGIKRKSAKSTSSEAASRSKKLKIDKPSAKPFKHNDSEDLVEDSSEKESRASDEDGDSISGKSKEQKPKKEVKAPKKKGPEKESKDKSKKNAKDSAGAQNDSALVALNASSSKEAHAKQKALAKERKAAKPNADIIERSKKLWEKLRLKSHVEKEERKKLVKELFEIVTGRVKDFVFKHDSVRVIQTAIKYSTIEQRRMIARELKGEFKVLAEGKYSKFLIAKLLEKGDPEIRDLIISEFYGHVRRLINHPEAAWILDDTYRAVATPEQKSRLLREWYGPEFAIKGLKTEGTDSAELRVILEESPEKRKPIMEYLEAQINQLLQKKLSGFTMLHDAMLQYFLACKPGSSEANDFLEQFRPDPTIKEGQEADNVDLLKNLAFTKSGSRLVSLAFAYGSAKDRKTFLRPYKDTIEMMAYDANAHHVLLAALAVVDDTKLTSKSIFGELLPSNDSLPEKVLNLASDTRARTVLLYPFASEAKWLIDDTTRERLAELYAIRATTSKKDPIIRQQEIVKAIEPQLLTAIAARTTDFASFGFGLQFMGEVLVGAPDIEREKRREALKEVVQLSQQILEPAVTGESASEETTNGKGRQDVAALSKNMLKMLVQGGKFDPKLKKVVPVQPPLGFADMFWEQIKDDVVQWATGPGSFVIVGLVESEDFGKRDEVLAALKKQRKKLETAAGPTADADKSKKRNKGEKGEKTPGGNAGARILLQKL
ncbi:pumilio domain-containing protein [Westerdykella ornata]|uniref:Pumilio domain-containing protein n=1 Tax=Westerdykella ornata TaxID=318751 RepID=A0A6A6JJ03_WESOR|nr:pumilio domain-containing protein [Westerdykella ornata]KAF2276093.1 pumilio domain-containing protein [Westerdykella ornata]